MEHTYLSCLLKNFATFTFKSVCEFGIMFIFAFTCSLGTTRLLVGRILPMLLAGEVRKSPALGCTKNFSFFAEYAILFSRIFAVFPCMLLGLCGAYILCMKAPSSSSGEALLSCSCDCCSRT